MLFLRLSSSVQVSRLLQKDAEQESLMRSDIQSMRQELSSISMMDEFARYARLERQINKMTDKLKTHGNFYERFFILRVSTCIITVQVKD